MRKSFVILALCAALPLFATVSSAQDNNANSPQPKPDTQDQQGNKPTLEQPPMAAPEPAPAPALKKPPAAAKPATKVDPNSGRVVEEIIARVNNEIITRSEYDKARVEAADEAKQECQTHCTPEQLQIAIE